jgi:hypothetical protein
MMAPCPISRYVFPYEACGVLLLLHCAALFGGASNRHPQAAWMLDLGEIRGIFEREKPSKENPPAHPKT